MRTRGSGSKTDRIEKHYAEEGKRTREDKCMKKMEVGRRKKKGKKEEFGRREKKENGGREEGRTKT